jgi:hypothetical protein
VSRLTHLRDAHTLDEGRPSVMWISFQMMGRLQGKGRTSSQGWAPIYAKEETKQNHSSKDLRIIQVKCGRLQVAWIEAGVTCITEMKHEGEELV